MALAKAWDFTRVWVNPNTNKISLIEFVLTFTDSAFPLGESAHAGVVDVSSANLAQGSSKAAMTSAVNNVLAPDMPQLTAFHQNQLRFEHALKSATAVDLKPVVPAIPSEISDRQFFHVLAKRGMITQQEALSAVKTGDMPQALENLILSLPEEARFDARILLEGAVTFRRDHPLTLAFGQGFGLTSAQIDELWIEASQL